MYEHACIFINKLFTFWFMGIFYKAIMQKQRFGQAKCKDLIKRISTKFIYYTNLYEFWKFERISWKYLKGNELGITWNQRWGEEGGVRRTSLRNRGKEEAGEKSGGRLGAR
jgi:hypothetical protein